MYFSVPKNQIFKIHVSALAAPPESDAIQLIANAGWISFSGP
jgi:hypothetical protein